MPDVASSNVVNNNCNGTTSVTTTIASTIASATTIPTSGVKVHQIASMFSSLQQQNRRSTIASLSQAVVEEKETISASSAESATPIRPPTTTKFNGSSSTRKPTRSRSTDSRLQPVSANSAADDLNFLDHREKFTSAKALFENLERVSREQRRNNFAADQRRTTPTTTPKLGAAVGRNYFFNKRTSSTSPERRPSGGATTAATSTVVTVVERREISTTTTTTSLRSPRTPPPPVPPKPAHLTSPTGGGGELDKATRELNDLVNSLQRMTAEDATDKAVVGNSADDQVLKPPTVATKQYEPYWRTPNYHINRRVLPSTANSATSRPPLDTDDSGIGGSVGTPRRSSSTEEPPPQLAPSANGPVEYMTPEEEKSLLSTEKILPRAPSAPAATAAASLPPTANGQQVTLRNRPARTSAGGEVKSLPSHLAIPQDDVNIKRLSMCSLDGTTSGEHNLVADRLSLVDDSDVHWIAEDQFYVEIDGLAPVDYDETPTPLPNGVVVEYKKPTKVKFSVDRIRVYSTYNGVEYDRRNDEIDPVAASAEYELERRLEKMDIFEIDVDKGTDGLGFSIIGMGVGADAGLEKLGIFVKSITPGGAVFRDGRICVCDQIVEVDGKSLVGVSQTYAASVLRGTSGHVKFKIGREKDLDSSEIAQLIRQSLEQDQASIAREQAILAERLKMSNDVPPVATVPPPRPPAWGATGAGGSARTTPLPSSDSVFEEDTNTTAKTPDENQRFQELMNQLKKSSDAENAENSSSVGNSAFHTESTSPAGELGRNFASATEEINKFLYADDTSDAEDNLAKLLALKEADSASANSANFHRQMPEMKCNSLDSLEDDESGLVHRIENLESTLGEVKKEADKYQSMLFQSQEHYDELEKRYKSAKKKLKDYQEREKELLEREEAHLQQLREKDAQYANLVKQLNDKVGELEKQLSDAQRKRASLAESASVSSMSAPPPNGVGAFPTVSANSATTTTDMSPALAYLPASKKTISFRTPDDQKPSTSGLNNNYHNDNHLQQQQNQKNHRTTIELADVGEIGEIISYIDADVRHDFGVPYTQLLDSTAAKSKAEAVKQSVIMCARSLPSRHSDAEVYVTCHHTMEHAEILKSQPSHLITESTSTTIAAPNPNLNLMNSSKNNSPSKSSSSTTNSGSSPLSSRRLLDLINFRKKVVAASNKDLELAMRGGGDFDRVPEVLNWNCEDVFKFLHSLGLDKYEPEFRINRIDGCKLLQLDGGKLKSMGVSNHNDRALIKKRVKELKLQVEKDRKRESKRLLQKPDRKSSKH